MPFSGEAVQANQCHFPVYETSFTPDEIQQLSSLFKSTDPVNPNSCLEGSNRAVYSFDERKERKKISNQESTRKAPWRKKMHLESLADEAKRLSVENLELKKELGFVTNKWQAGSMQRKRSVNIRIHSSLHQHQAFESLLHFSRH